ncbi:hypothetical protein B0H13DRAFT_2013242 [Mycena leptocephala]|nr:hypothetical protein B0H13DRAFT_2013242 [Mycena leptocephala]
MGGSWRGTHEHTRASVFFFSFSSSSKPDSMRRIHANERDNGDPKSQSPRFKTTPSLYHSCPTTLEIRSPPSRCKRTTRMRNDVPLSTSRTRQPSPLGSCTADGSSARVDEHGENERVQAQRTVFLPRPSPRLEPRAPPSQSRLQQVRPACRLALISGE